MLLILMVIFEQMMGGGDYSTFTVEDHRNLAFYKKIYEQKPPEQEESIPKLIHLIWLGPDSFPKAAVPLIKGWQEKNPGWQILFWNDCNVAPPCEGMERHRVGDLNLSHLNSCYDKAESYAEKKELLRYEILYQQGGVVIDENVELLQPLLDTYHFYCGLETLGPTVHSTCVLPSPHLIASKPEHPIIKEAMEWVLSQGSARSLSAGIERGVNQEGNRDVVFPATYFSSRDEQQALMARRISFEEGNPVVKHIKAIEKKNKRNLALTLCLTGLNLLGICLLFRTIFSLKRSLLILFLCLFCSLNGDEFDDLMGKETKHWKWVKKQEELAIFKALYYKNRHLLTASPAQYKIPKTIHFIWLGPKPFPPESVENVRMWMAHHPGWTVKLWTDRERELPCADMKKVFVRDFKFLKLKDHFLASRNFGEKSDILRYEILFQEGGVYVDHDANCLHSFDTLHSGFDFYCGLEMPHPPLAGFTLTSGNGIVGSRPQHPIIEEVIHQISRRWDEISRNLRGEDGYTRTERVLQRTYIALTHALKTKLDLNGNTDIVLPAAYFFAKKGLTPLYSQHFFANAWADGKKDIGIEKELRKLERQSQRMSFFSWGLLSLNLLFLLCVLVYFALLKDAIKRKL